jgi:PKD repeat protein
VVKSLITLLAVLALLSSSNAALTVSPTTTLAAETGNNTSASSSFVTHSNGDLGASNISKVPTRNLLYSGSTSKILAHFMGWFGGTNHMNVGYTSADPAQVKKQVDDIMSRGIQGVAIDWYGTGSSHAGENNTAIYMMQEAQTRGGQFEFSIVEDSGALTSCANTAGCSVTQALIKDLNYVATEFEPSPAYLRISGRPVIFFFLNVSLAIDWDLVRSSVQGNPLFIFRNSGGFTQSQTSGSFSWVGIASTSTDMGLGYLDSFDSTALTYPAEYPFASAYKGFNDTLAAWGKNRIVSQQCGQTWLATMAENGKYYSSARPLDAIQLVTWNDYEEGTEIETGIDNCVSVSASTSGSSLNWGITGQENTLDHYTVYVSTDGQNLMPVADIAAGSPHSFDLSTLGLAAGSYVLYVKAVGKAGLANHMSAAVSYSPVAPPSVSVTISSPANNATVMSPMALSATATSSAPINSVQVYVDGVLTYQQTSATLNISVALSTGTHQIAVKGWNTSGSNFVSTINVNVVLPPVANLALTPTVGIAPVTVTASTAGSTAPSGSIASTSVNFGDGSVASVAAGGSASHIYNLAGTYKVTTTVTDNLGHSSSASASATVSAATAAYVKITTPTANAIVSSPVHIIADSYSPRPIAATQIYIDGVLTYRVASSHIDTLLPMSVATHRLTVKGWDTSGANFMSTIYITVH